MSRDLQDYINKYYDDGNMSGSGRLSRVCESDLLRRSLNHQGYIDKKSPKLLVGWQVILMHSINESYRAGILSLKIVG